VLAVAGTGLCALCSVRLMLVGLVALAIGWCYSAGPAPLKATAGGVTLAGVSVVLLCYAAGAAIAGGTAPRAAVAFGVAEAVWLGLCGTTKDFSDIEGDRLTGRRTWPIVLGDRRTRRLVAVASGSLAAIFAAVAWLSGGAMLAAAATAAVGGVAVSIAVLCSPATGSRVARRWPYRALMMTQYAVNVVLLVSTV
jgi:4-hydroxybenzoate polyprenyltransferase